MAIKTHETSTTAVISVELRGARQRRLAAAAPFAAGHLLAQACGENHGL
jgi:hypothetical protein